MLVETYTCLIFPHPLRAERIQLTPPLAQSINDTINEYLPDCPKDAILVYHNSLAVPRDRWLTQYVNIGDLVVIRVVPMGAGFAAPNEGAAGGKAIAGTVLFGVVTLLSLWNPIGWVGIAIGIGAGIVGTALTASSVAYYTRMSTDSQAGKSIRRPSLTGGGNSIAQNAKVPMIYGKRLIVPYYAAPAFVTISYPSSTSLAPGATEQYGRNMYLNMLYMVGYSGLTLTTLKFGDRVIAYTAPTGVVTLDGEIGDCEVTVIQGGASLPSWCSTIVKQQQANSSLDRFNNDYIAKNLTIAEHSITSASGNWGADQDVRVGDYVIFTGVNGDKAIRVTGVSALVIECARNTLTPGTIAYDGHFSRFPGEYYTTPKNTERIEVIIEFPNGLLKWNGTAKGAQSVMYKCFYRLHNATNSETNDWSVFSTNWKDSGSSTNGEITAASNFTLRFMASQDVTSGEYDVMVARWTTESTDTKVVDSASLLSVTSITNRPTVSADITAKCCMVAIRARATQQLSGSLEQFNLVAECDYTRSAATGDEAIIRGRARNPAAAFVHACMGSYNPRPAGTDQIDWPTLKAWSDACYDNDYTCDIVEGSSVTFKDCLETIAASGRAHMTVVDGKYSVIYDFAKANIVQHITPFNSWGLTVAKKFQKFPHGVRVTFFNEAEGYESDEVIALAEGYIFDTRRDSKLRDYLGVERSVTPGVYALATEFEALSLPATTNSEKAVAMGRYYLDTLRYQDELYTVNMDAEQLVVTAGDIVKLANDTIDIATTQGRVKELDRATPTSVVNYIFTDQECVFEYGKSYGVRVRTPENSYIKPIVNPCATGETISTKRLQVHSGSLTAMNDANPGDLFMFGLWMSESMTAMVVAVEMQEDLAAKLTMTKYDDRVFAADTLVAGEIPTSVTRVPPVPSAPIPVGTVGVGSGNDLTGKATEGIGQGIVDSVPGVIAENSPRYIGQYDTLPASAHLEDIALKRTTVIGTYVWKGTSWLRVTDPGAAIISMCWPDICALVNAGFGTLANYIGESVNFAEVLAATEAFINRLYSNEVVIQTGGHIRSSSVSSSGVMPSSGKGFWIGADGQVKLSEVETQGLITTASAGDSNVIAYSNNRRLFNNTVYSDFGHIRVVATGTARIKANIYRYFGTGTVTAAIYRSNGVMVGSEVTTSGSAVSSLSVDASVTMGDIFILRCKTSDAGTIGDAYDLMATTATPPGVCRYIADNDILYDVHPLVTQVTVASGSTYNIPWGKYTVSIISGSVLNDVLLQVYDSNSSAFVTVQQVTYKGSLTRIDCNYNGQYRVSCGSASATVYLIPVM